LNSLTPMLVLAQQSDGPNPLTNLIFFIAIMVFAFYFIIIRPQRREAVKREETLASISKGTKIITAGGIHGTIVSANKGSETVEIEVAKGVRMTFNRASISVVDPGKKAAAEAEKDKNNKKAKSEVPDDAPPEEEATPPAKKGKK